MAAREEKNEISLFLANNSDVVLSDFLEYLKNVRQEENLFFYLDVQRYKKLSEEWARQDESLYLYVTYIHPNGRHRINIAHDISVRMEKLHQSSAPKATKDQFRAAEQEVTKLLHTSVLPVYMRSCRYTKLVCEDFSFTRISESDRPLMYVELYYAELKEGSGKKAIRSSAWTKILPPLPEDEENKHKTYYYDSLEINLRGARYFLKAFASARMNCGRFIDVISNSDYNTGWKDEAGGAGAKAKAKTKTKTKTKAKKIVYGIRIEPRGLWMKKSHLLGDYAHFFHALLISKSKNASESISLELRPKLVAHAAVKRRSKSAER